MPNIAMWSGPRNISTAMMYAFASRADCRVWDEPFYAWYLAQTGMEHPMREEIIAHGIVDAKAVIARCSQETEGVFYQKHMTQHMLPELDRSWLPTVKNAFLIRHPVKVLASYAQKRQQVLLADIGFVQQLELFEQVADFTGEAPPVVDSDRFLDNPVTGLQKLCTMLGITFQPSMLTWPAGPKPFDGVWAAHWYNAAWQSTGFARPEAKEIKLPDHLQRIADEAMPIYNRLAEFA